jgi:tetratricopeptide (TPR) repeat protein
MIHAPKLRAEAKHVGGNRQLRATVFVLLLACQTGLASIPLPPPQTPRQELRAAKLLEAALSVKHASDEEWKKLEHIYAGLEAKYPRSVAIRNGHAEFLWERDEQRRAVETWLAAEKLDPANAVVLDHLGGSFVAAGEVKRGASYFQRAMESAPGNAEYHFDYANVAFMFRHDLHDATHPTSDAVLEEALKQFAEAVRLQPRNAEYARAFAEAFYTAPEPDWQAALAAWQHFYEVSPQKDFALLNVARVQMKLGDKAAARAALEGVQGAEFGRLKARLREQATGE